MTGTQTPQTLARRRAAGARRRRAAIRIRYLVVGLIAGGIWAYHAGEPPWKHAVKLAILLLIFMPIMRMVRGMLVRRPQRARRVRPWRLSWPRLIAGKVTLLVLAFFASWVLQHWLGAIAASFAVAAGLVAVVAVVGPLVHRYLIVAVPGAGAAPAAAVPPAPARTAGHAAHPDLARPPADADTAGAGTARPGHWWQIGARLGGLGLLLGAGFAVKQFAAGWLLRNLTTTAGITVAVALFATIAVAGGLGVLARRRRTRTPR